MESEQMSKQLKVEIPSDQSHVAGGHGGASGLSRQGSMTKTNCLCSPTTHVGSFRCRLHRAPNLQRTKSIDSQSASASLGDSTSKPNPATANCS